MKSRMQKAKIYNNRYSDIPRDYNERLTWMYKHYHITSNKADSIITIRNQMMESIYFEKEIYIILYEEPEGSPRPRARMINRSNLISSAISNPNYIQIYSLTGASDRKFMQRLLTQQDFYNLDHLIHTPCYVQYDAFLKTPSSFNSQDTFLAELGYIRPITKPDFDNIEKKYSDMYNNNIWLDDALVIESHFRKYYSILPRVEITLRYLNILYNKYQYESITKRVDESTTVQYFSQKTTNTISMGV